jgi:hypothetical protein
VVQIPNKYLPPLRAEAASEASTVDGAEKTKIELMTVVMCFS